MKFALNTLIGAVWLILMIVGLACFESFMIMHFAPGSAKELFQHQMLSAVVTTILVLLFVIALSLIANPTTAIISSCLLLALRIVFTFYAATRLAESGTQLMISHDVFRHAILAIGIATGVVISLNVEKRIKESI